MELNKANKFLKIITGTDVDRASIIVYRGAIVDTMIFLETIIEDLISMHFCGAANKEIRAEFIDVLFSKEQFSMSFKSDILNYILTEYHKDLLEEYAILHSIKVGRKIILGSVLTDIGKLIKFRNKIAHGKYYRNKTDKYLYLENNSIDWYEPKESKGIPLNDDIVYENLKKIIEITAIIANAYTRTMLKRSAELEEKQKPKK